jgi:RHS repeat-associated protein
MYNPTGTQQTMFGFTGEITDVTGQVYLRARYYNPTLGIFPSLDPLEGDMSLPMALNRYG